MSLVLHKQTIRTNKNSHPSHPSLKRSSLLCVFSLQATDRFGRVPAFYANGAGAAEMKQELVNPALPYLMAAAADANDTESVKVVRERTGLLGLMSKAECVDVDAGDGWTPLMEAVVHCNNDFARALLDIGAQAYLPSTVSSTTMPSAAFWAAALYGPQYWTEAGNFPEFCKIPAREQLLIEKLTKRIAKLRLRDRLVLEFNPPKPSGQTNKKGKAKAPKAVSSKTLPSDFESRLKHGINRLASTDKQFMNVFMQHLHQELTSPTQAFSVLDFLRRLGHEARYPGGDETMAKLMLRTRVFALSRLVSGDSASARALSPQEVFAVRSWMVDPTVRRLTSDAMSGVDGFDTPWVSFGALLWSGLRNVESYPNAEVFRTASLSEFEWQTYRPGDTICWGDFSTASVLRMFPMQSNACISPSFPLSLLLTQFTPVMIHK